MANPNPPNQFKPGQSGNPGGRTREQRSAARQQARLIQEMTGNGKLMAEFAVAVLIAGGRPDESDPDADVVAKLAERNLRRFGLSPDQVTLRDRQWATEYLSDRGLGKPVVDVDVTSDGQAVGSISLIPVNLGTLTDAQLEAIDRQIAEALPAGDGDDGAG